MGTQPADTPPTETVDAVDTDEWGVIGYDEGARPGYSEYEDDLVQ